MIDPQCAENLLHDLVAIHSPSHEEAPAVRYLVDWMNAQGYDESFIDAAGNAVGIIGSGSRDVVLLGHIDTFGGDLQTYIDGRTLHGRGTVDAKGALCTFAVAARRAQCPPDTRFIVVGAVEEEASTSKGARHIAQMYQPTHCIIGEPSAWDRLTLGYKGRLILCWRWEGDLAHSASAVTSPAEHAVAFWQDVVAYAQQINADRNTLFSRLDATLQDINTGQNGAFGWAEATIGFRLPPDVDPHTLAEHFALDHVSAYSHEKAHIAARDTPISRVMRRAIRAHGGRPRFVHKTGTSDMNVVAPLWQCPMLAYGPGDSALDHTPHEHLDLDEYQRAINVLTDALSDI